jgi:membrane protease YdiL (CAAX protease family)
MICVRNVDRNSVDLEPQARCRKPRNAWLCIATLIGLELLLAECLDLPPYDSPIVHWMRAHPYQFQNAIQVFRGCAWVVLAYWFSHTAGFVDFVSSVTLYRRPSLVGWFAAWATISLAFVNRYALLKGWTPPSRVSQEFFSVGGAALGFYIMFTIIAGPFFEELVLRGFIYMSLRKAYGQWLSAIAVIMLQASFHWGPLSHSFVTSTCFLSGWAILCVIQERTRRVWNCVLAHSAFNAAAVLPWPACLVGMLCLLPVCFQKTSRLQTTVSRD